MPNLCLIDVDSCIVRSQVDFCKILGTGLAFSKMIGVNWLYHPKQNQTVGFHDIPASGMRDDKLEPQLKMKSTNGEGVSKDVTLFVNLYLYLLIINEHIFDK